MFIDLESLCSPPLLPCKIRQAQSDWIESVCVVHELLRLAKASQLDFGPDVDWAVLTYEYALIDAIHYSYVSTTVSDRFQPWPSRVALYLAPLILPSTPTSSSLSAK